MSIPSAKFALPVLLAVLPLSAASFRAAAAKVDITPQTPQWLLGYGPRQSTGVHDRIYHRVIALDDGRTQFFLVSSDLCLFSPELYDEVASDLQQQGIERKQFWWSVTHTHSAPEVGPPGVYKVLLKGRSDHEWDRAYTTQIKSSVIQAIKDARDKLEPARLRTGLGMSLANINRRAKDVDGKISSRPQSRWPRGPADRPPPPRAPRWLAHRASRELRHPRHRPERRQHRDLWRRARASSPTTSRRLSVPRCSSSTAPPAMPPPSTTVYPTPSAGHLSEFRVLLGDRILEANRQLTKGSADINLRLDELTVETALKPGLEWPPELARYSRVEDSGRTLLRLPVRVLRLNDAVIWSAPVELFSEIAIEVRARSPFAHTLYFGYTNGWFGYLPTAKAFAEGGYEPQTSPFTEAAEADLTRQLVTFLQGGGSR